MKDGVSCSQNTCRPKSGRLNEDSETVSEIADIVYSSGI